MIDFVPTKAGWQDQAACLNRDPATWFPAPKDNETRAQALAICRTCTVQTRCLEDALENRDEGIRGATTAAQRAEMRAKNLATPFRYCQQCARQLIGQTEWRSIPADERDHKTTAQRASATACASCAKRKRTTDE